MVRVEEAEVMGHPWSAFLDEGNIGCTQFRLYHSHVYSACIVSMWQCLVAGDSTAHATLRADVNNLLKAISPESLSAAAKGGPRGSGGDLD